MTILAATLHPAHAETIFRRRLMEATITPTGCVVTQRAKGRRSIVRVGDRVTGLAGIAAQASQPIPLAARVVRHTCDNPECINPDHLIPGTHAENSQDALDRGRLTRNRIGGMCRRGRHLLETQDDVYTGYRRRPGGRLMPVVECAGCARERAER